MKLFLELKVSTQNTATDQQLQDTYKTIPGPHPFCLPRLTWNAEMGKPFIFLVFPHKYIHEGLAIDICVYVCMYMCVNVCVHVCTSEPQIHSNFTLLLEGRK